MYWLLNSLVHNVAFSRRVLWPGQVRVGPLSVRDLEQQVEYLDIHSALNVSSVPPNPSHFPRTVKVSDHSCSNGGIWEKEQT